MSLDSNLERIEDGAFSATIFSDTHTLTIRNSQILRLENVFGGLSNVNTLSFYGAEFQEITTDAFAGLLNLQTLEIEENGYLLALANITGGSIYNTITSVSLRGSEIRSVAARSLVGVPRLRNIYLQESRISHIDSEAFAEAGTDLLDMHFEDNMLTTVDVGVFSNVIKRKSVRIYLERNPWNCECSQGMQELQMLMAVPFTASNFPGDVYCSTPDDVMNVGVQEADLGCPETTMSKDPSTEPIRTPSMDTTSSTTTAATPPINTPVHNTTAKPRDTTRPDDRLSSTVEDGVRPTRPVLECSSVGDDDDFMAQMTVICEGGHRFNVTEVEEGTVLVTFHWIGHDEIVQLFWFLNSALDFRPGHSYERTFECRSELESSMVIGNLVSNSIYTFCLMPLTKPEFSPFDCLSISLQPAMGDRPWLRNRDRVLAYVVITLTLLIVFCMGILLTFLCLKHRPNTFIRQMHSITTSQEVMIMPPLPKRNRTTRMDHKR